MKQVDFIHLRVHTAYSLAEGAIKIKDLIDLCYDHKMPAVAMTDTGNLFGVMEFCTTALDHGIQPIIGSQVFVAQEEGDYRRLGAMAPPPDHLVLLVQNSVGWQNLSKLTSNAYLKTPDGETPRITLTDLEGLSDGLIALSGGPSGAIGRLLAEGQTAAAQAMAERLAAIFPGRFYIEIMRHGLEIEAQIEDGLIDLAYHYNLPLVATNDVFFAKKSEFEAHEVLLCIADGTYIVEDNRRRATPEHRFKTAAEMRALFADLPEAIDNSVAIAKRCAFAITKQKEILPAYTKLQGRSEAEALRDEARLGLEERLNKQIYTEAMDATAREQAAKPYRDRLEDEINVICRMGFPGYFLIVADFIRWAKSRGIPVGPGRGSGAGSVVAWALTITDLDPLRWGLLFERFLNPERISMPDFDIDFCQDRREEVIRYVQSEYGNDRVAQIITFGKLQARAVLRDVGRVLGLPYGQVDRICKMVPNNPANPVTLQQAIDAEPILQRERKDDPAVARMMDIALSLEGLYRHASTHAAGVVIGDRPLQELVPLYRDPRSDMPITQFNMKDIEKAGLVKFDFLGLKTLTILVLALSLIAKRNPETKLDLAALPLDDPDTFAMLGRAEATGVFQLESSGMRDVLRKLKPDRFEDIIAVVALYRPGPMENIPSYINRKHGREKPDYLHPLLEPILKETFGIMIYQEQVMQIAQVLSGYSLGEADILRRAMGKKIQSEMDAQRERFISGAKEKGVEKGTASMIFDQVAKFAGYGFNKSHAAAYALIAYQTAYFKANYPVEFMAATMTYDLGNTDKLNTYRQELQRLEIELLPPDVNRSEATFSVETGAEGKLAIRYALTAVKNIGKLAMEGLAAERHQNGPFRDLADFARRMDPKHVNKRMLSSLGAAGAFDSLDKNRARVCGSVETILRHAFDISDERTSNQVSLFGDAMPQETKLILADTPLWTPMEALQREFEVIGFYLSAHPLDAYTKTLQRLHVVPYSHLLDRMRQTGGTRFTMAGVLISKQERRSARGSKYAFAQFTDASGLFEVTLFSEVLSNSRDLLENGKQLILTVDAELREEGLRLTVHSLADLEAASASADEALQIWLASPPPVDRIALALKESGKGRVQVSLMVDADNNEVRLDLPGRWAVSAAVRGRLKTIAGVLDIREI
ncbi:MAG: DNA polymerase III subunit alpha [Alphaproteobacteria bacterium]